MRLRVTALKVNVAAIYKSLNSAFKNQLPKNELLNLSEKHTEK